MELRFPSRQVAGPVAALGFAMLFCLVAAYAGGLINVLGYESRHETFGGFASGTGSGAGFGLKDMVFFEGQTFYARYDLTIHHGAFRVGIFDLLAPLGTRHYAEEIATSGQGEVTYRIPKTGLYTMYFHGTVSAADNARGYDISYEVTWGTR